MWGLEACIAKLLKNSRPFSAGADSKANCQQPPRGSGADCRESCHVLLRYSPPAVHPRRAVAALGCVPELLPQVMGSHFPVLRVNNPLNITEHHWTIDRSYNISRITYLFDLICFKTLPSRKSFEPTIVYSHPAMFSTTPIVLLGKCPGFTTEGNLFRGPWSCSTWGGRPAAGWFTGAHAERWCPAARWAPMGITMLNYG